MERLAELLEECTTSAQARWLLGPALQYAWHAIIQVTVTAVAGPAARRQLKLGRFRTSGEPHSLYMEAVRPATSS